MSKGRLLVIEGLDGSGKATQAKLLAAHLAESGRRVMEITFPDYESDSSALVKMYLSGRFGDKPDDVNPYAASSFYAVDRYASYKTKWGSFYEAGGIVIADRYTRRTRCISAPSSRRSSGTTSSAGPLTTNTGCWACPHRTLWCTYR